MGTQDENNMAEPQNEFLSGFKLKNRMESRKDDTQKPVVNQAEKNDRSIPYKKPASESNSNIEMNKMGLVDNGSVGKKAGSGLLKKFKSKLPKGKSNQADAKQKIMVALIPVLFIVMIFMFRHVLSKPQQDAQGSIPGNETVSAVKKSSDNKIEWNIPEPLTIKKSTGAGAEQNTASGTGQENITNDAENGVIYIHSILYSSDKPSVVIGNKIVYLNQEINGAVVVEIHKDYVVFEKDSKRWTQKVAEQIQQNSTIENIK